MSWITIAWSIDAALSFTLAGVYLLLSLQQRERWDHWLFFVQRLGGWSERSGPMRKLGRGFSNFFLAPAEVFASVTIVNTHNGNAAAAE
jgi:hypothetical protein